MANLTRFDPFNELARFDPFRDVDDLFRGFMVRPVFRGMDGEPQIKLDVSEEDKSYLVKAEIPGVKKEDIHVSIDGNQVSISAELKKETEEKEGKRVIRSERYYGKVYRSFSLDQDVDQGGAQAKYSDGVLEVTLPKKPGTSPKQLIGATVPRQRFPRPRRAPGRRAGTPSIDRGAQSRRTRPGHGGVPMKRLAGDNKMAVGEY